MCWSHSFQLRSAQCVVNILGILSVVQIIMYQLNLKVKIRLSFSTLFITWWGRLITYLYQQCKYSLICRTFCTVRILTMRQTKSLCGSEYDFCILGRLCVLQWVTVCCSVLQCVAVCCSVLQCVAVLFCILGRLCVSTLDYGVDLISRID